MYCTVRKRLNLRPHLLGRADRSRVQFCRHARPLWHKQENSNIVNTSGFCFPLHTGYQDYLFVCSFVVVVRCATFEPFNFVNPFEKNLWLERALKFRKTLCRSIVWGLWTNTIQGKAFVGHKIYTHQKSKGSTQHSSPQDEVASFIKLTSLLLQSILSRH